MKIALFLITFAALLVPPAVHMAVTQPTPPLVVPDDGYNSPTDLLQTSSGINVYQNATGGIQR